MNAVGKLGNYISRGVVTVSAPFHPFGGAVDIVVVEQRDGTFKSSPWYVQFGKFQGILKARGKVVSINVNGVDADLRMYLDNRGGAHFLKEVDGDEGMSESICSSNQSDASSFVRGFQKCNSCNDELKRPKKKMNRSCTTGPRVLGFELGRRSWKEKRLQKQETADGRDRENSLERAEIAADLLEIRWSTSLATAKHRKNIAQLNSESNSFHGKGDPEFETAANYMESFIMKETYLDFDVYGSSVGDSGTNSNSFKSDADEIFSGDEQSVSPQSLQSGDERRMIRDESSISCVTSESLTSRFDGSSGGSSDNLCDVEHGMISTVNSDLSSCTPAGEVIMNTENLEDKDPCVSIDGFKYNNSTARDVKTELELDADLVVESKTIGSPVNYVDEMVANKIPSVSRSIFDSKENSSSEIVSSFASADLLHTSSCEKTDGEQNMSVDLDYSVKRKNVSMDDISSDSAVEESSRQSSASIKKKIVWVKTPTSEQLASLNLKRGRNEVTFTFFTPVLGDQKIDARIHLWKWDTRIVISDVDGTITKSDVLGQFMPLVGVDWSQTGVAHLFSAIKENGYELLFLSARAISQASLTRQFLFNLKQDGKALPEGPVVISPDGLLPSLIREVIRRAPHEFKIACLETIRDLFPPDHNPFYAGFGNRDTDELSYLKVGVPKGKIFIINPKGEVAVQHRVDRKSYTSLHTIVHDMFPPPSTISSSEQEDFNSWNFWRLPHPEIVV